MNVQPLDIWRQIPVGPILLLVDLTMTPDTKILNVFGEKLCFSIYDL